MADDINTTLEALRDAIKEFTQKSGQCCQPKGSKTGSEPSTQAPEYGGPDDEYPDQETFFDARCNACNGIYDTLLGVVDWLADNNVDWKAGLFGGLTTGLVFALLGAGPAGWAVAASGAIITGLAVWLIKETFDFSDLSTALDDVHEELVKGLYNTSDNQTAKVNFLSILGGATPTPSSAELYLIEIMLGGDLLNNILEPRSDMASYQSPDPIDCGTGALQVWSFVASGEGWVFEDQSAGTQSATGTWIVAKQAWEIELTIVSGNGAFARGAIKEDGLSIAVDVGNSVQLDYSATSDGYNSSQGIIVTYTDLSEDTVYSSGHSSTAGTLILSITESKSIKEIEVTVAREDGNYNYTLDLLEVRVQ